MGTLAENLKAARDAAGLSQPELARAAKVSQQLISQIERGVNLSAKAVTIAKLAAARHKRQDFKGLGRTAPRSMIAFPPAAFRPLWINPAHDCPAIVYGHYLRTVKFSARRGPARSSEPASAPSFTGGGLLPPAADPPAHR